MSDYDSEVFRIRKLLEEVRSDSEEFDESDSDELDNCEELSHISDSETDGDEDCETLVPFGSTSNNLHNIYIGNDKETKWKKSPPQQNVRTRRRNIISHLPGVKTAARNAKLPLECFSLFIDEIMIRHMTYCTNIFIDSIAGNYSRERDAKRTNEDEIKTVIGLLILAGCYRSGHQNLKDLLDKNGFGVEIFHATMNLQRFLFLIRCLRFDDIRNRQQRREIDNLAPFREIFELFVQNCEKYYSLSEYTTIDEQLVSFRGRCSYRVYMPSKPAKYGLKMFTMCDARTWYTQTMDVYLGKQPEGPYKVSYSPTEVVKRLVGPIEGSGRNVTVDNWFCSFPLADELLRRNLTLVGTLRKNKKELPSELVSVQKREIRSSLFAFRENVTAVSYVPKKGKNVILLSSMHFDAAIDPATGEGKKPEIITMYNMTKAGVNTVDEMCATYSTSRRCRRWPLSLFFRLLDIAGINAQIIFSSNNPSQDVVRRMFLREVGESLVKPGIQKRADLQYLPKNLRAKVAKFSGVTEENQVDTTRERAPKSGRCTVCPRQKDKKTKAYCCKCFELMCVMHMKNVCEKCMDQTS